MSFTAYNKVCDVITFLSIQDEFSHADATRLAVELIAAPNPEMLAADIMAFLNLLATDLVARYNDPDGTKTLEDRIERVFDLLHESVETAKGSALASLSNGEVTFADVVEIRKNSPAIFDFHGTCKACA